MTQSVITTFSTIICTELVPSILSAIQKEKHINTLCNTSYNVSWRHKTRRSSRAKKIERQLNAWNRVVPVVPKSYPPGVQPGSTSDESPSQDVFGNFRQ